MNDVSNEPRDANGRWTAGSTDPNAAGHQAWARKFTTYASSSAFGNHTVNSGAVRTHMHAYNSEVKAAIMNTHVIQQKVNETMFAIPYKATPRNLLDDLKSAESHQRSVEKAARRAAGI